MSLNVKLNYQVIAKILGIVTLIIGLFMLPALFCAVFYGETENIRALMISSGLTIATGSFVIQNHAESPSPWESDYALAGRHGDLSFCHFYSSRSRDQRPADCPRGNAWPCIRKNGRPHE